MNRVTPAQCRAARALLGWSQHDLARRSGVARQTIIHFESDLRAIGVRGRRDIAGSLETAGVIFGPNDSVVIRHGQAPAALVQSADSAAVLLEKAKRWRMRAEEYRVVSENIQSPVAREAYAHLATTYERLADQFEIRARLPSGSEQTGRKDQAR